MNFCSSLRKIQKSLVCKFVANDENPKLEKWAQSYIATGPVAPATIKHLYGKFNVS